jgi:ATP-dependent exoDNAse (exonuclease V) beta subunit
MDEIAKDGARDPLGFGTLVHELLERAAFDGSTDIHGLCEFLAPQHLEAPTSIEIGDAVSIVENFLKSARAAEIVAARCVLQEPEFLLPWPESGSNRYFHGYIDCLYQHANGEWHLVDYKSNQVAAAGVPALARAYEMQMFVYALACERSLGLLPSEVAVCFLRPGVEHAFRWSSAQRAELSQRLNAAIESLPGPTMDN